MPYTNKDGDTIDANTYVTQKYRELFEGQMAGTEVFKSIQNDKNLTDTERQEAFLAVGKAATRHECQIAKDNPGTLMRGGGGCTQFISTYIKTYGKSYVDAVRDKAKESIENPQKSEDDIAKDIMVGFSSELPKLSKEAAQFLKVTGDVVKTEFPKEHEQLNARILVNNMSLRGGNTAITQYLRTDSKNGVAATQRSIADQKMNEANALTREAAIKVDTANDNIKKLGEELEKTTGQLERGVIQKNIDEWKKKLEVAEKNLASEKKKYKTKIDLAESESKEILAPHQERLDMINRGMEANNRVLATMNHIDGFTAGTIGEGELDVNPYKASLKQVATGEVPGQEITEEFDLPEVDTNTVDLEVSQKLEQTNKLEKEQQLKTTAEKRKAVDKTFDVAQDKAAPELAEISTLEKRLDSLNHTRKGLKTTSDLSKIGPGVDTHGKIIETFKPTAGDRFKAFFTKGGMDEVLRQKAEKTISQLDNLKLKVQVKTDPDFLGELEKSNTKSLEILNESANKVQRAAQYYEAAQQQVFDAQRSLQIDANLQKSGMYSPLSKESRQELQSMIKEGESAMLKYQDQYFEFRQLDGERTQVQHTKDVRAQLQKEHALSQHPSNTQGTTVKQGSKVH